MTRCISVVWAALGTLALSCAAADAQRLTVATYGGNWGEAQKACILDPFAKASGIEVIQETSVSTVTYNKLKQEKGNPSIDIAWIDGGISELAAKDGVVEARVAILKDALTPLVLDALLQTPSKFPSLEPAANKGASYVAGRVQPDGSIDSGPHGLTYPIYTSAGAVLVLSKPAATMDY